MSMGRFHISVGSDDRGTWLDSFIAAEEEAKERSLNRITGMATIKTANGTWLATYKSGKLTRCDLDLIAGLI